MQTRKEIIDSVLDSLWSASCGLKTLEMAGQGTQAKQLGKLAGKLQSLQADIMKAERRALPRS